MLEKIFEQNLGKYIDCTAQRIPYRQSQCEVSLRLANQMGNYQECCNIIDSAYGYSDLYTYLPYAPGHINFCIQNNLDVISAPFSGCDMVAFEYKGDCIMGSNHNLCIHKKTNCPTCHTRHTCPTCPYKRRILIAHVAHDTDKIRKDCQKRWIEIKENSDIKVKFSPHELMPDGGNIRAQGGVIIYGIITTDLKAYSVVLDNISDIKQHCYSIVRFLGSF